MIELKNQLQIIASNNYALPEKMDPFSLSMEMLSNIGSTDCELRDDLIYSTLANWIVRNSLFTTDQLLQILSIVIDEQHAFYRIGETGTDSVFTRSFSILIIPLILYNHRLKPFISTLDLQTLKHSLFRYLAEEQDLRGYVPEKGWAHAIAHTADALDELVQCPEMDSGDLLQILEVMVNSMDADCFPFTHGEEERMTTAVINLIRPQLVSDHDFEICIHSLVSRVKAIKRQPLSYRYHNTKIFLRSLFFRLQQNGHENKKAQMVMEAEHQLMQTNPY
jgi:hypothetical protein